MTRFHTVAAQPRRRRNTQGLMICLLAVSAGLLGSLVQADEIPEPLLVFLEDSCFGCHDESSSEGNLRLESHAFRLASVENFHTWERVFDRVKDGEMPPDETLDETSKQEFLSHLGRYLRDADSQRIGLAGRVPLRRLTRSQYQRTVNEMLGTDIRLEGLLPADSLTDGYDTVAASQQISDHLMAAYLRAADTAIDAAISAVVADSPYKVRLGWTQLRRDEEFTDREPEGRPEHKDIVSWSTAQNFYGRMKATSVPETGRYRIRVRARAVNTPADESVWCSLRSGVCAATESTLYWIDSFEATTTPAEHLFEAWIRKGHMLQLRPNDSGLRKAPIRGGQGTVSGPPGFVEPLGFPGVAIEWIELERLVPHSKDVASILFGDLPWIPLEDPNRNLPFEVLTKEPARDARTLIRRFATRAFRRPVADAELAAYFSFAENAKMNSGSFAEGVLAAYRAILCSSRFLYFEETVGELDDAALAARLSYFLWGSSPDRELQRLAAAGKLKQNSVLQQQTNRLLNDPRSNCFVQDFTDQWLKLYELEDTTPDGKLYGEYDDVLHHSLRQETHAFVRALVDENLPVTNIVDSDFTFVNSRLARHYGVQWPGGTGLQRITLKPNHQRGGLITHASVLKVTANGTTTSPILRGVWMMERILGQHVPPPPANVPAVEPDIRGATTIREQLDKHRNLESCAACHVKIDPPGFALENYDVIGGYRENYRATAPPGSKRRWVNGPAVDPSYALPSGQQFANLRDLKQVLTSDPAVLATSLVSHLATYATGAKPTFADRQPLHLTVAACEGTNYGVRSLIHRFVQSPTFRNK